MHARPLRRLAKNEDIRYIYECECVCVCVYEVKVYRYIHIVIERGHFPSRTERTEKSNDSPQVLRRTMSVSIGRKNKKVYVFASIKRLNLMCRRVVRKRHVFAEKLHANVKSSTCGKISRNWGDIIFFCAFSLFRGHFKQSAYTYITCILQKYTEFLGKNVIGLFRRIEVSMQPSMIWKH